MRAHLRPLAAALALSACATTPKPAEPAAPAAPAAQPAAPQAQKLLEPRPLQHPAPLTFVVQQEPQAPAVALRLVFHTGSVDDPKGKEGLTALTAAVLSEGGTRELSSAQLLEVLFPMAAQLDMSVDKELTVLSGRVHTDHLDRFLGILTDVLLAPRLDPREFERLKADALTHVRAGLRNDNDERLGQVALDALLYEGHPYAHYVQGTERGLESITLEDVKAHAQRVFTQDRLVVGLAGPVDAALQQRVKERLAALPATGAPRVQLPPVPARAGQVVIVKKPALSTAVSLGYATELRRDHPDFFAVATAMSYLGEHRQSTGVLFSELREKRGLNYGDYAYAEHFIQQGGGTYARTNIARTQQDLTLWVRPVVPANGVFATRGMVHFFDRLAREGIPAEDLERTKGFLDGYTRLWELTQQRRLGHAIDGVFYGTPDFLARWRAALPGLTPEVVKAAVQRHLDPARLNLAFVTEDAEGLQQALTSGAPSPIQYASPKDEALLKEDAVISTRPLPVAPGGVRVVEGATFMAQ